jgi:hypothetical protein
MNTATQKYYLVTVTRKTCVLTVGLRVKHKEHKRNCHHNTTTGTLASRLALSAFRTLLPARMM